MRPRRASAIELATLVLIALLVAAPARAFDPRLGWHTLETPHFLVHYHDGLGLYAQRAARAVEAAHARLVPEMGYAPAEKTLVVLTDDSDDANGSAGTFLRPVMHFFAVAPDNRSELNDYEDSLWNLAVHEYTHILHLDQAYGLPAAVNRAFGRMFGPNYLQPLWFIEGYAVTQESRQSGGGRARSSLVDMMLRTEILEGAFLGLDDLSHRPVRWPRGAIAHLRGGRFVDFIARTEGMEALAKLSRNYGGRVVPYAMNLTATEELGASYLELYERWRQSLEEEAKAAVAAARRRGALTEPTRLTSCGERTNFPSFSPDGRRLFYVEVSADRQASLRSMEQSGSGDRLEVDVTGSASYALAPDGRSAVVAQPSIHRFFNSFDDLYAVDLVAHRVRRLTDGGRYTEPAFAPDGRSLVAVKRMSGGRQTLVRLPPDASRWETLYSASGQDALFTPRFSPDGKRIAFSEHRAGRRDLRMLDLESGTLQELTRDRALDLEPAFDPSGKYLLFASDRTGIYNLYARDLKTGETLQVTNVTSGAFAPAVSPDGTRLAFITYSSKGYDLASLPFDPSLWTRAPDVDLPRPAPPAWEGRELYPAAPYEASASLLPRHWLPLFEQDPQGPAVGVSTGGSDVVGFHAWSARALYGIASRRPAASVSYSNHRFYPALFASAGTQLGSVPGARGILERQSSASVSASFAFNEPLRNLGLSGGYELRFFSPGEAPAPEGPADARPVPPERGLLSTLSAGLFYSDARRFANAISPEEGQSFSFGIRSARPELGSAFSMASADASLTRFLRMPWLAHHALALRVAGGAGAGSFARRRLFTLGGIGVRDPILDALSLRGTSGASLRGYRPGAFSGNAFLLANAEYRFPIAVANVGPWSLPVYLRRVSAALTFDAGTASDTVKVSALRPSVGAELRGEVMLGYVATSELRLGYAKGLAPEGIHEVFLALGSSY